MVHLLTRSAPKLRLATGGIWDGIMMSLGQLGYGAKAAGSGRSQVGSDSRG